MCISDHNFLSKSWSGKSHNSAADIGIIIVPLSDTSITFFMQVEFSLRNIFSYRAISDFSLEN